MAARRQPLFLARRRYRERRLMDAARILPVIGAALFLLPVIWSDDPFRAGSVARGGIYVFGVWAALIAAAFLLSRRLGRTMAEEAPPAPPPSGVPPFGPEEDV